jgi:hypothetical protein
VSAAKAEPIAKSPAPMQPWQRRPISRGWPTFPARAGLAGGRPTRVQVTETVISRQNIGLACLERPVLTAFVDVAGADIDVCAPGSSAARVAPALKDTTAMTSATIDRMRAIFYLFCFLGYKHAARRNIAPQCLPRPTSSSPRSIISASGI